MPEISTIFVPVMEEKIYSDPEAGEVRLRKSLRSRRVSIRVHPSKGIIVTVPYRASYDAGLKFFFEKREWVISAVRRQKSLVRNVTAATPGQVEALRKKAKELLPARLAALASMYGFTCNSVTVKNNSSNWGSCSSRGNINLNLRLAAVPEPLGDYVMLHELCHLRHLDHGAAFHALQEALCLDRLSSAHYEDERDDMLRADILAKAARSVAAYPVSRLLEKTIRTYSLAAPSV